MILPLVNNKNLEKDNSNSRDDKYKLLGWHYLIKNRLFSNSFLKIRTWRDLSAFNLSSSRPKVVLSADNPSILCCFSISVSVSALNLFSSSESVARLITWPLSFEIWKKLLDHFFFALNKNHLISFCRASWKFFGSESELRN